jgi:hypothetical protein
MPLFRSVTAREGGCCAWAAFSDLLSYLSGAGQLASGCIARNACPVGAGYRYPVEQLGFHMVALGRM